MGASQLGALEALEDLGAQEGQAGLEVQGLQVSLGAREVLPLLASLRQGTLGGLAGLVPLSGLEYQVAQWGHWGLQSLGYLGAPEDPDPLGCQVLPWVQAVLELQGVLANLCVPLPPWALWDLANP